MSKAMGITAAAVDSVGHVVVQAVAGAVCMAASAAVSHTAYAIAMAKCAAE
jgi:hypothetical protein